jgi:hypothetical protein
MLLLRSEKKYFSEDFSPILLEVRIASVSVPIYLRVCSRICVLFVYLVKEIKYLIKC